MLDEIMDKLEPKEHKLSFYYRTEDNDKYQKADVSDVYELVDLLGIARNLAGGAEGVKAIDNPWNSHYKRRLLEGLDSVKDYNTKGVDPFVFLNPLVGQPVIQETYLVVHPNELCAEEGHKELSKAKKGIGDYLGPRYANNEAYGGD